jgi:hypothetical protein
MIGCTIQIPLTLPREFDILFAPGPALWGIGCDLINLIDSFRLDCNRQYIREGIG